jgi:hypothetical protein
LQRLSSSLLFSLIFLWSLAALGQEPAPARGIYPVTRFGAKGDGVNDDTQAFQTALNTAGDKGGGIVQVPVARFLIKGHLLIPRNVTLEGIWRAPQRGFPIEAGSTLLAIAGKGEVSGKPFITMRTGATLSGITIYYPEQIIANPPIPYPWTVQSCAKDDPIDPGNADNCTILNVTMINPYQAVDFGTYPTGRHYINGLYAHALFRGLYIDQCYDVGRIENIHFWPFWDLNPDSPLWKFTKKEGVAFTIGRTDGQMATNLFSIFYQIGMRFIDGGFLPGSGVYTNCYMDVSPCAVQVEAVMANAGVSFVNGMFMSQIKVKSSNTGQVKFVGSGFWATPDCVSHASLEGLGTVFFEGCHFSGWDRRARGAPCIDANNRRLIVQGCEFNTERDNDLKVRLGKGVRSAVITGNLLLGGEGILNQALPGADLQVGLNSVERRTGFIRDWLVLGGFPNPPIEAPESKQPTRLGYDKDYLEPLGGEGKATLSLDTVVPCKESTGEEVILKVEPRTMNRQRRLDLKNRAQTRPRVSYACTWIESATDQTGCFFFGSNDSAKVWLNGELVHSIWTEKGRPCVSGNDFFEAKLHVGLNPILIKVEDGGGHAWEFTIEGYDEKGEPLRTMLSKQGEN